MMVGQTDVPGYRADVLIELAGSERADPIPGMFQVGSRSVMFHIPAPGGREDGDMFGAVIEQVTEQGGQLRARLLFWNDLARIHVTPGKRFQVWYARTIGTGIVLA